MRLIIKLPTRKRPDLFLKTLSEYIRKAAEDNQYIISYDFGIYICGLLTHFL